MPPLGRLSDLSDRELDEMTDEELDAYLSEEVEQEEDYRPQEVSWDELVD